MHDTDSDTDLTNANNVLNFQDPSITISARGPYVDSLTLSGHSFRNNMLTTSIGMPWNNIKPRYAQSVYDHGSRRETSPLSLRSARGFQPQNFQHLYYPGGISSHRSMHNGRSSSPMSVRSTRTIDSNTSASALEISQAMRTGKFNKLDLRMMQDTLNKLKKGRLRRGVEKRRKRMFLKSCRKRSGGDSGDQSSDSSLSSNCGSNKTSKTTYRSVSSCRSTQNNRTDFDDFRRTVAEGTMYKDCTGHFKQTTFKSMFDLGKTMETLPSHKQIPLNTLQFSQNTSIMTQRNRYQNGFLLPSQRFNQSGASLPNPDKPYKLQKNYETFVNKTNNHMLQNGQPTCINNQTDSEQEEIFSEVTVMENRTHGFKKYQGKRSLNGDDICVPDKKRTKPSSPTQRNPKPKSQNQTLTSTDSLSIAKGKSNDFVFAKPKFPVRKPTIVKRIITKSPKLPTNSKVKELQRPVEKNISVTLHQTEIESEELPKTKLESVKILNSSVQHPPEQEQLISKSVQPLDLEYPLPVQKLLQNKCYGKELRAQDSLLSTTDLSMRPSFIKRKLFSQKVDDGKNVSSDSVEAESLENNVYSSIQKEKNKARKLTTTQSCLSRDVLGDESNLLDLIHKIVPKDRMHLTSAKNKSEVQTNKSKPADNEKWDVTAIISSGKNGDESDTFTDEEIFVLSSRGSEDSTIKIKKHVSKTKQIEEDSLVHKQKDNQNKNTRRQTQYEMKTVAVEEQNTKTIQKEDKSKQTSKKYETVQCKVTVEKIKTNVIENSNNDPNKKVTKHSYDFPCAVQSKCFWDTDIESDFEMQGTPNVQSNNRKDNQTNQIIMSIQYDLNKKKSNIKDNAPPVNNATVLNPFVAQTTLDRTMEKVTNNIKTGATEPNKDGRTKIVSTKSEKVKQDKQNRTVKNVKPIQDYESHKTSTESEHKTNKKPTLNNRKTSSLSSNNKENKTDNVKPIQGYESLKTSKELEQQKTDKKPTRNKSTATSLSSINNKPNATVNNVNPIQDYNSHKTSKESEHQKINKKPTLSKSKATSLASNSKGKVLTLNNNTLRIQPRRNTKVKNCCTEMDKSINNSNQFRFLSLRSREIDMSASLNSNASTPLLITKAVKRIAKNKNISRVQNNMNKAQSDISFSLPPDTPANFKGTRMARLKGNKTKETKINSDVSFSTVDQTSQNIPKDNTSRNNNISKVTRNTNKNLEQLHINTTLFPSLGRKSPIKKFITGLGINNSRRIWLGRK